MRTRDKGVLVVVLAVFGSVVHNLFEFKTSSRLASSLSWVEKGYVASSSNRTTAKLANDCHFVFLDVGANLGLHGRFLFEPNNYPQAQVARQVFDQRLGEHRDNRDVCVFAFEPNPAHRQRHLALQEAYGKLGWRYHYVPAGVGDQDGTLTFYHNADEKSEEWGFGMGRLKGTQSTPENVTVVRLADWLLEHVQERVLPTTVHSVQADGVSTPPPYVLMKMDIEGMEYSVLPDLMFSGALCETVDYVFGEIHDWFPVDFDHDRGGLHLKPRRETAVWRNQLLRAFHAARHCRTSRFDLIDDESYLHDGIPLPGSAAAEEQQDDSSTRSSDILQKTTQNETIGPAAKEQGASTPNEVPQTMVQNETIGPAADEQDSSTRSEVPQTTAQNETMVRPTAAICAIVKDEEKYLEEWILYNIAVGFDRIYLYNNSPNQTKLLHWMELQTSQAVPQKTTIFPYPTESRNRQLESYTDCVKRFGETHKWLAFLDPDEFLVLKRHENVIDFLNQTAPEGSVSINWVTFGTSNHTNYMDLPVTQRFQYHVGEFKAGHCKGLCTVKTIVNTKDFVSFRSPHWAYLKNDTMRRDTHGNLHRGKRIAGVFNPTFLEGYHIDIAALHHYTYKSIQEYRDKFCNRGDVYETHEGKNRCAKMREEILPAGHVHDDLAWIFLKQNVPKYRKSA